MCFYTNQKQAKIAKEDITVYKVINKNNYGWLYNLVIDNKSCKWKKGYEYTELDFPKNTNGLIIYSRSDTNKIFFYFEENGFHSKKTKKEAMNIKYNDEKIVKMIIPKGSYYYENENEYFSQKLIY